MWEVQLSTISFGTNEVEIEESGAVFDSGTALITLSSRSPLT